MNKEIEVFWEQLKTQRDELRVRAQLVEYELRDEWEVIEQKWHKAERKFQHLQDEATESTVEMKHSVKVIMDEISDAYDRIKIRLKD
jgi:hypothetical protein